MIELSAHEKLLPLSVCSQTKEIHQAATSEVETVTNELEKVLLALLKSASEPKQNRDKNQGSSEFMAASSDAAQTRADGLSKFRKSVRLEVASQREELLAELGSSKESACEKAALKVAPQLRYLEENIALLSSSTKNLSGPQLPDESKLPPPLRGGAQAPLTQAFKTVVAAFASEFGFKRNMLKDMLKP